MKIINQVCIVALILMAAMIAHQAIQAVMSGPVGPVTPTVAKAIRVLIVADSSKPCTPEQSAALNSARAGDIDAWCRLNCAQANGTAEKRVWEPDEDVSKESKFWQEAIKHDHGELPEVETYANRHWNKPHTFKNPAELMTILGGAKGGD